MIVLSAENYVLPERIYVSENENAKHRIGLSQLCIDEAVSASVQNGEKTYCGQYRLFGAVPVKEVSVTKLQNKKVMVCGDIFGIKMMSRGAIVVRITGVQTAQGYKTPAKDAGLEIGDIIKEVNGEAVRDNDDFSDKMNLCKGGKLTLCVQRNGEETQVILCPEKSADDNLYKAGMWVRDSAAGIGILTFFDVKDNTFAGLGHGICENESGVLIPIDSAEIVKVGLMGINKSSNGSAGSLQGYFKSEEPVGTAYRNKETGIYGKLDTSAFSARETEIAFKQSVKKGKAQILTTVDESGPQLFDIEIEKINYSEEKITKNMQIKITDKALLEKTGGIVQGMSGSPIIQGGRLIGAVTHVFVNDTAKGYGIFIENMLGNAA